MIELGEKANEQQIDVPGDGVLEIRLPENPTTGYSWQIEANGAPVCLLIHDHFAPGPRSQLVGQGGTHHWRFQVVQPGLGDIALAYRRPWEQTTPARTFTVHIRVTA